MAVVAGPGMNGSTPPSCSICIANYNGEAVLIDCIDSVLAQRGEVSYEIIIHDDASSDASLRLVRERYPADRYPNIRILESAENVGFCVSNNRMAAEARGEYLLLLNNDATLQPDALETFYSNATAADKPAVFTLPQFDAETGELIDAGCYLDLFLNPVPNRELVRKEVAMAIGACLWIPRTLWQRVGGFPEWFGSLAEDLFFCCVARLWGYRVICLPDSGYLHAVGHSFGGGKANETKLVISKKRRRLSERNKNFAMLLCYPAPVLAILFPIHVLLLLGEGTALSLLNRRIELLTDIYLHSLASVWRTRSTILEARHRIQLARRIGIRDFFKTFKPFPRKLSLLLEYGMPRQQR